MAKVKQQFPNIYRSFTERFTSLKKKNSKFLKTLKFQGKAYFFIVISGLILFLSLDLLVLLQKQKELNFEKEKIQSEIKLWEEVSKKYKGYKEAYYQLSALNYRIGEVQKAREYVDRALYLDPNFEKARSLQKEIRGY